MANNTSPYAAQARTIEQKQNIANAMRMSSLKPIEAGPTPGAQVSWAQMLAQVIQAYAGNKMQDKVNAAQQDLSAQALSDRNTGIAQFEKMSQIDPQAAVAFAMQNPNPQVGEYALSQQKRQLGPKDKAKYAVPEDILSNPNDPSQWRGKVRTGTIAPGNVQLNLDTGQQLPGGGFSLQPGDNGQTNQVSATGVRQVNQAPNIRQSVTTQLPVQDQMLLQVAKDGVKQFADLGVQAGSAQKRLTRLDEMEKNIEGGMFTGTTSGLQELTVKLAESIGIPISEEQRIRLANTEKQGSQNIQLLLEIVDASGGLRGVTETETREIKEALLLASKSPTAQLGLLQAFRKAASAELNHYGNAHNRLGDAIKSGDKYQIIDAIPDIYIQPQDRGNGDRVEPMNMRDALEMRRRQREQQR